MMSLLLNAEVLNLATDGISIYVGYVRALGYAIAAVIVVAGSFSVYMDYIEESPIVRAKVMKLCFSCLFLVAACTSLPMFFGLDGESTASYNDGGSSSSGGLHNWGMIRPGGIDIGPRDPHVVPLPGGGNAIIWNNGRIERS